MKMCLERHIFPKNIKKTKIGKNTFGKFIVLNV